MKITVPTCHIVKLKQLGCYDQWLKNVKLEMALDTIFERIWSGDSWICLIETSFTWSKQPEGQEFWNKVADS